MAAPAVEQATEALYAEAPLDQQLPLASDANPTYGDHEAAAFEDDEQDRQSYPLGQSHTPLTSIPTLGQALLDGNTIDRKYVHSFLQVLADHSQFSDKYQHYEEDEYERKRKRKLRESERKMFFYAGQSMGGASGEKGKSARGKSGSGDKGGGGANKKRRRKERERERERVLDKDERRQLAGSAPMLPTAHFSPSDSSDRSSPFNSSPPTSIPAERASMPNMTMPWNDRNAFYSSSGSASIPSMPSQVPHPHGLMRHRASMPHIPAQPRATGYLHHSAPLHGNYSSASSSFDFVPQTSPLSLSSSTGSSYVYSSSPSPSPSHIVPIKAGDYAPSPPTYHHGQLSQAGHYHHHQHHQQMQQQQQQMQYQHPQQQQQQRQAYPQYHQQEQVLLEQIGPMHFTAEEQQGDLQLDDQWGSASSSSISTSAEFGASGSESFSSFGPYDPASLGVNAGGPGAANEGLTCADMAAAAASAVEGFMFLQHHNQQQQHPHQHAQEESSPEGQQQAANGGLGGSVMEDDDWLNSFFDCAVSPLLGPTSGNGDQCYQQQQGTGGLDTNHIDSLFADVEAFYGRLVN
jgi:hypothetical protein